MSIQNFFKCLILTSTGRGATMKKLTVGVAALLISLGTVKESHAGFIPVTVSYTVSGSSGNYDLNFTVTNNMLAWPTQDIYLFGVRFSNHYLTGSPTNFVDYASSYPSYNPALYGGPNIDSVLSN